jgi:energy-coupling factor transport system permease protein
VTAARLPRDLHPVAWWLWAIGLATAASLTTNPLHLLLLVGVATVVVMARRSDQPWARSFRLYVWVGVVIVVIRVLFRLVFGGGYPGTVLLDLPSVPLPDWVAGITLFGPVTREALLAGLYDGLRLATIVICIGAANSLANPKRLLRSVPPALYEIGTALVVAVTVLPQFADSVRRVRAAQSLRAGETGRVGRLRRFLVPVLEDALERSLALAAGMDARGYGRANGLTRARRRATGALMLVGLGGICVGTYAVLDQTAPRYLALPMLVAGVLAAVTGLLSAGRRVERSRYRPDRWRWPELVVVASGVFTGATGWWVARHQTPIAFPDLSSFPELSGLALLGAAVALAGALCSPPPSVAYAAAPLRREAIA